MKPIPDFPTITGLHELLRHGEVSITDWCETLLERIEQLSPPAVFISLAGRERVLSRARLLDGLWRERGHALLDEMPLLGIPFVVKDNIDVAGLPTTCACPSFARIPERSATVVERLEAAGAIALAKTNLDQFATGLVGMRSPYGEVANPFDESYICGGSSSGSAVAVARGFAAFALGTDTAGSGRVPAGFCNLVGVKPTPGLVSTRGVFPACKSLDCVSVLSHTVADGWHVLSVMAGRDAEDPFSRPVTALPALTRKVRIGVPAPLEFMGDATAQAAFEDARARLATDADFELVPIPLAPFLAVAKLLYDGPWVAERRLAVGEFFNTHATDLEPSVGAILSQGSEKTAVDTFAALHQLEAGKRMAEAVLAHVDLLLVPTTPTIHTREAIRREPIARNSDLGLYTNFVNLLGMCALALPGPFRRDGLPAGITLLAAGGADQRLAEFARRIEPLLHQRLGCGRDTPPREVRTLPALPSDEPTVTLAVVGAHLSGMPLNWQLQERGARLLRAAKTAACYRLFALPGTVPPKPGLVRLDGGGAAIAIELWQMPLRHYGSFVAAIPAPLGIGTLTLDDGSQVQGFLCEGIAVEGAEDITSYGGWRAFIQRRVS